MCDYLFSDSMLSYANSPPADTIWANIHIDQSGRTGKMFPESGINNCDVKDLTVSTVTKGCTFIIILIIILAVVCLSADLLMITLCLLSEVPQARHS